MRGIGGGGAAGGPRTCALSVKGRRSEAPVAFYMTGAKQTVQRAGSVACTGPRDQGVPGRQPGSRPQCLSSSSSRPRQNQKTLFRFEPAPAARPVVHTVPPQRTQLADRPTQGPRQQCRWPAETPSPLSLKVCTGLDRPLFCLAIVSPPSPRQTMHLRGLPPRRPLPKHRHLHPPLPLAVLRRAVEALPLEADAITREVGKVQDLLRARTAT